MISDEDMQGFKDKMTALFTEESEIPWQGKNILPPKRVGNVKEKGSTHYKTGGVEPIDLYRAGGMLQHFALCNIIKYAFRNRDVIDNRDMDKIIHYAEILKGEAG